MDQRAMKTRLESYRQTIETFLSQTAQDPAVPPELSRAMSYSLFAGGKRVRPILCLAWAEVFGAETADILPFACGLELIHTYSLVHDDLPAMDNDDYRRGQPSNHIRFGEDMAILAGDGLLTEAFSLMLAAGLPADRLLKAVRTVAEAAGPRGMVGGQVMDMNLTGRGESDLETLKTMHGLKTGAMFRASCQSGALLAGASRSESDRAGLFGTRLGLAFQVADDILDVVGDSQSLGKPTGSDQEQGKLTYPALLGIDESRRFGNRLIDESLACLQEDAGPSADFLRALSRYIMERTE